MEAPFNVFLGLAAAVGLAAACGFRVFVPLFAASLAIRADLLDVNGEFAWLGSTPALVCLGAATLLEIGAYYVPVVDNFLDAVATPAAAVAGTLVAAAFIVEVDPWLQWTLAVIAGGGTAAAVQVPTVGVRGASTVTTAGIGNPVVSTGEAVGATAFSGLAVFLPFAVPVLILALVGAFVWLRRRSREDQATELVAAA